jgi:hypothetical protein
MGNVQELWNAYRIGRMTEQGLDEWVDGGKADSYWLTTVDPPFWFLAELMEAANSTSGLRPVCVYERR